MKFFQIFFLCLLLILVIKQILSCRFNSRVNCLPKCQIYKTCPEIFATKNGAPYSERCIFVKNKFESTLSKFETISPTSFKSKSELKDKVLLCA